MKPQGMEIAGSPKALHLAECYHGSIDFLLTDVILPKMNGRELAGRLSNTRPEMKVLYVSGYTDGIVREGVHGALEDGLAFLQKPYSRGRLTGKLREMLDSPRVRPIASKR